MAIVERGDDEAVRLYALLIEHSSEVVFHVVEGRLRWVSPTITAMAGWSPEDLVGRQPAEFGHPDDLHLALALRDAVAVDGEASAEFRFRTHRGGFIWVEVSLRFVSEPDGTPAVVGTMHDVTTRHEQAVALADSERRYRLLAENSSDVVCVVGPDERVLWVSPAVTRILGWRPEELVGRSLAELVHPEEGTTVQEVRGLLLDRDHPQPLQDGYVVRLRDRHGTYRWYVGTPTPILDDQGHLDEVVIGLRDIDELVRVQEAVAESERHYRLIADNSGDLIALSRDGRFEWVAPSVQETLGFAPEEVVGRLGMEFIHPDDAKVVRRSHEQVVEHGTSRHRVRYRHKDGSWPWFEVRLRAVYEDGVVGPVIGSARLVDDEVAALAELEFAATHDPLTRLANRAHLVDAIRQALTSAADGQGTAAVLLMDLDHFKFVNDSLGHATGDELLRLAADRILTSAPERDLVGRHGGDEFVVVLRDLDSLEDATRVAERLVEAFRAPIGVHGDELFTTASIGVAVGYDGVDADTLLAEADTALYTAKRQGRDRYAVFTSELREQVTERLRIENGLRLALDRGELTLWYQPEVDLDDGSVTSVEALLRWRHPDGVVDPAARFLDVAEDSGLIVDIGAWVVREGMAQAARWASRRPGGLEVRINLSARQLSEPDLLDQIDDALVDTGALPSSVCFEITETAIMRDLPTVWENVRGISERGFTLAIDDFGTGYASLTYLHELPISVVKLDRSFVADITSDRSDRELVTGVIDLAHRLGVNVTAEGVEHPEQATMLRGLGCTRAQGWLFAQALPEAELDAFLAVAPPRPS